MDISESLEKIYSASDLIGKKFYKQFFADCPEAVPFFDGLDMERQAVVVTMALTLVERHFVTPFEPSEAYFRYLGTQHRDLGIPTDMYPKWVESMLKTLASVHGDDWDDRLSQQWRDGIQIAIEQMLIGYELPI